MRLTPAVWVWKRISHERGSFAPNVSRISRALRRDRELAFYGSEDLTPSDFYQAEDAREAFASARWVVDIVRRHCLE